MNRQRNRRVGARERGITLIVGMIMLILITLLVLATFHLGRSNLAIVGNVQHRNEALGAAQQTIEAALSSPLLTDTPTSIFPNPCQGANTLCYDVNGDGADDFLVTVTPPPSCVKANVVKTGNLRLFVAPGQAVKCTVMEGQNWGEEGAGLDANSDSKCSTSLWDVRVETRDVVANTTNAAAVVNQGVATLVSTDDIATSCP